MAKSIEQSDITPWATAQLTGLGNKVAFEQGSIDASISKALTLEPSKQGGDGGNRLDGLLLLDNGAKQIPVILEFKGTKGKLEALSKQGLVILKNDKNEYEYKKYINSYAVNGAAYYASVVLRHTDYQEIVSVGVNGYKDSSGTINYEVKAYVTNVENPDLPILIGEFEDLSFLSKSNIPSFFQTVSDVQADPIELHRKHIEDEARLDKVLKALNQHLRDETKISVTQRISVVTPCIMAGLGVKDEKGHYTVSPLKPSELTGSSEDGFTDGDKIFNKVTNFLKHKNLPQKKQEQIENSLRQTLLYSNLSKKDNEKNISPLKSAYQEVYENIIPAYHLTGSLDFTGKLFNVMNDWVAVPDGDANDVVLTPRYVTDLMAKLTEVDMDSFVWDWALGSGGFLISAMNLMLKDAKERISSPADLAKKQEAIKSKQLLGVEKLPDIYILAVLNMILMGDGSSNILNKDSLNEFSGNYAYGDKDEFPANVFLLNPPYSAEGNGMIFVEYALNKMKSGKAAVIIQDSAGSGKAKEFNKRILKNNRLLASIKMNGNLFKANVKTNIYLFEVGKKHKKNDKVKFIDFSEDGYKRSNRKKSSNNLIDDGTAKERYTEILQVVKDGVDGSKYFENGKNYIADTIDPDSGEDWNFGQHQTVDKMANPDEFRKTVSNYMIFEISQLLKGDINEL